MSKQFRIARFLRTAQATAQAYYQQDESGKTRGIIRYVDESMAVHWLPRDASGKSAPIVGTNLNTVKQQLNTHAQKNIPGVAIDLDAGMSSPWHAESNFPFDAAGNKVANKLHGIISMAAEDGMWATVEETGEKVWLKTDGTWITEDRTEQSLEANLPPVLKTIIEQVRAGHPTSQRVSAGSHDIIINPYELVADIGRRLRLGDDPEDFAKAFASDNHYSIWVAPKGASYLDRYKKGDLERMGFPMADKFAYDDPGVFRKEEIQSVYDWFASHSEEQASEPEESTPTEF